MNDSAVIAEGREREEVEEGGGGESDNGKNTIKTMSSQNLHNHAIGMCISLLEFGSLWNVLASCVS